MDIVAADESRKEYKGQVGRCGRYFCITLMNAEKG
jgi:hypothetical protein